jgi:23S rRNA (uridine2552-2'-O)-methyltransferase
MNGWQPQDHYFRRAKKEGFIARSVYKLEEVDRRVRLFKPGQRVLDLGCHPGSWLQYCARAVGKRGLVVGVDTRTISIELPPHVHFIQADVFELLPTDLYQISEEFDVVLSDLAPATTGIRSVDSSRSFTLFQRALTLADDVLVPGVRFSRVLASTKWSKNSRADSTKSRASDLVPPAVKVRRSTWLPWARRSEALLLLKIELLPARYKYDVR